MIEAKCEDWETHAILGRCYRVNVKEVQSKTIEETVRKELLEAKRQNIEKKGQKRTSPIPSASESESPPRKRSRRSPSTDDSSEHRGSGRKGSSAKSRKESSAKGSRRSRSPSKRRRSPSRRRRNADKAGKSKFSKRSRSRDKDRRKRSRSSSGKRRKDEKEHNKAELQAQKEKLKMKTENQKKAARVLSKISTILPGLIRDCKDRDMKHVPKYGADPAKKSMATLSDLKSFCEAVISDRGEHGLDRSMESLEAELKAAMVNAALLDKLLKTARAHA